MMGRIFIMGIYFEEIIACSNFTQANEAARKCSRCVDHKLTGEQKDIRFLSVKQFQFTNVPLTRQILFSMQTQVEWNNARPDVQINEFKT